jgi:hypothetical protein
MTPRYRPAQRQLRGVVQPGRWRHAFEELFTIAPQLRALFPVDLTSLRGHFEPTGARDSKPRRRDDPAGPAPGSACNTSTGVRSEDYFVVRDADPRHPRWVAE